MIVFACTTVEKTADVDSFADGCEGKPRTILLEPCQVTGATIPALLSALGEKYGLNIDEVFLPDPDDIRYIGYSRTETINSDEPTADHLERWKRGEFLLYLCDYTFCIERRDVSPVTIEDFAGVKTHD